MLLKLIWTLAMLFLAAYAQARARYALRGVRPESPFGMLGRARHSVRGLVFLAWACLLVVTATAVWISWLWALALLGTMALPPIAVKVLGDRFGSGRR